MADCIYNLRRHTWIFKCVTDQKKRSKVALFTGKMCNELKRMKKQFSDFQSSRYGRFCTGIQKKKSIRPGCLRIDSPSQLDIEYHWLAFLKEVRASPTKKMYCSEVAKFSGKMHNALKQIFQSLSFFLCNLQFLRYGGF